MTAIITIQKHTKQEWVKRPPASPVRPLQLGEAGLAGVRAWADNAPRNPAERCGDGSRNRTCPASHFFHSRNSEAPPWVTGSTVELPRFDFTQELSEGESLSRAPPGRNEDHALNSPDQLNTLPWLASLSLERVNIFLEIQANGFVF